ncbi:MAG TPA: hypothetical protein VFA42_05995 [Gaiellaceae bacterium]|jgi:hypothetical protein|nr:hypothetical protein [Gaiellaceae bacterium]
MSRALGLPALVVSLCIGGYLAAKSMQSNGTTSPPVQQAITQASANVAATNFQGADTAMQAFYAQNGTYAGATLPPGSGVVLVRADAASYCLQAGAEHENGPGGQAEPGGC